MLLMFIDALVASLKFFSCCDIPFSSCLSIDLFKRFLSAFNGEAATFVIIVSPDFFRTSLMLRLTKDLPVFLLMAFMSGNFSSVMDRSGLSLTYLPKVPGSVSGALSSASSSILDNCSSTYLLELSELRSSPRSFMPSSELALESVNPLSFSSSRSLSSEPSTVC